MWMADFVKVFMGAPSGICTPNIRVRDDQIINLMASQKQLPPAGWVAVLCRTDINDVKKKISEVLLGIPMSVSHGVKQSGTEQRRLKEPR